MREIVLIRGLPGSGKSTMAKSMVSDSIGNFIHVETDEFFVNADGEYRFDGERLTQAHHWCQDKTLGLLQAGFSVIVSNTFSRMWEMKAYYDIAASIGANVRVITVTGQYQNVHGVPEDVIERMRMRWQS